MATCLLDSQFRYEFVLTRLIDRERPLHPSAGVRPVANVVRSVFALYDASVTSAFIVMDVGFVGEQYEFPIVAERWRMRFDL